MVPWFTRHFGKRNTFIYSHLLGFVVMLVMFIVGWSTKQYEYSNAATLIICLIGLVLLGIPFGISNIMTYALIGDTVEYLEFKTGERAEGICFAMQTLINKVGMAVGAFIGVLAYYMAGIEANNVGSLTSGQKDIMWLMLIGLGCLSMLGAAVPMFFYKFNEKAQREAVEAIAARKAENSSDKAE